MLESVLPLLGAAFLVGALAVVALTTVVVFGSFLYGCVASCVVAIRGLRHRPAVPLP